MFIMSITEVYVESHKMGNITKKKITL